MNKKITFIEALLTAVGMVIGSGIFFRANKILDYTEGNVGIAILGWLVYGLTLIFAGIGFSILASRTKREGGIIGYMEDCFGPKAAFATGWFTTFIYIPLLTGILSIVSSTYFFQLIGVENASAILVQGFALFLILLVNLWNYLSTKFAALFSSAATVIKLLPIVIIGLVGMTRLDLGLVETGISNFNMALFTAPLLSMAFAFDGWVNVATLSRDMENPQRDIARVLALNAVIVTAAYVIYFTGISMILTDLWGEAHLLTNIREAGPGHVGIAANAVMGEFGEKFILFCVVMSCLGTLNGDVMAGFRYPHAMAQANELPKSKFFAQESKYGTTGRAAMISLVVALAWFVMYTIQAVAAENGGSTYLFSTISFDDIPIMAIAAVIIILLIGAIRFGLKEKNGIFKSLICPVIGIVGQFYVIYSFVLTNEAWLLYMIICVVIVIVGFVIRMSLKNPKVA